MADYKHAQEALGVVSEMKSGFRERDSYIRNIEDVVFQRINPTVPEHAEKTTLKVHNPLAFHGTNLITAALSVNPPTVQYPPTRLGEGGYEDASRRENFSNASWIRQQDDTDRATFRNYMWDVIVKGCGVLKTIERSKTVWAPYYKMSRKLRQDLKGQYPGDTPDAMDHRQRVYDAKTEEYKRGIAAYPLQTTDIPPESLYYVRGDGGMSAFSEIKLVPYHEVLAAFKLGFDRVGRLQEAKLLPEAAGLAHSEWDSVMSGLTTLKVTELWDVDDVTYIVEGPGEQGNGGYTKTVKHGLGDQDTRTLRGPYFVTPGLTTSSRRPELESVSVLHAFISLYPLLDSLLTMQGNMAYDVGYNSYFQDPQPGTGGALEIPGGLKPGAGDTNSDLIVMERGLIYPVPIRPIEQARAGIDFDKFLAVIRALLELVLPPVVQGSVVGTDSGYEFNQAAYLARLAWNPIVDNVQRVMAKRNSYEWWLIENCIKETVYAWGENPSAARGGPVKAKPGWLSLGPDDIKGSYYCKVHLSPETPANDMMNVRLHAEKVAQGFESKPSAIEALGGQADQVEREIMFEEAKALPSIRNRVFQRMEEKLGLKDQQAAEQANQQTQQLDMANEQPSGQTPGSGAPGAALPAGAGQVYAPGMNMSETPTPPAGGGLVKRIRGVLQGRTGAENGG